MFSLALVVFGVICSLGFLVCVAWACMEMNDRDNKKGGK